jgi:Na+-transporting methylmalonyl-CoA/oxaloacetate decarboxylase gamma subunit
MSAPIDHGPNTVSFYAPTRRRAVRLPQVSEAAALAAVRMELGGENGTSRIALADLLDGETSIPRQRVRPARSLDPEFVPAPPVPLRSRWWLGVCLVMAMLAIGIIAFSAIGRFFPSSTTSPQQASDRTVNLASSSVQPAAGLMKAIETEIPRLSLGASRGMVAPLGLALQGPAEGAILLNGSAAGITVSAGSDIGADAWQVPATDAVVSNTWILPPKDFIGVVDLLAELQVADTAIAHRWLIHRKWAAAAPAVAISTSAVEAQRLAVAPRGQPMPPQYQPDREQVAILIKRGKGFIANRDPASARVVLQRAAESKDAEAALMLAATYDPVVLRELKVYGLAADVSMARTWYEKAKEFGSEEASRRLETLASATR